MSAVPASGQSVGFAKSASLQSEIFPAGVYRLARFVFFGTRRTETDGAGHDEQSLTRKRSRATWPGGNVISLQLRQLRIVSATMPSVRRWSATKAAAAT